MKKIIIAESIKRALDQHETILGRGSLDIVSAGSSEEILDTLKFHKADLIITDFTLPVMGGARLCTAIRRHATLKDVSIIMVCDSDEAAQILCREARANAVVLKPVDTAELFSKISELLVVPLRQDMRSLLHVSVNSREGRNDFLCVSNNISLSGLLLETEQALRKGDRLTCRAHLGHKDLVAECEVIRVEKIAPGKLRYGVKFLNLDTKSLIIIEQFVKGRI